MNNILGGWFGGVLFIDDLFVGLLFGCVVSLFDCGSLSLCGVMFGMFVVGVLMWFFEFWVFGWFVF